MNKKMEFDALMSSLASQDRDYPRVRVDVPRVMREADARQPLAWRNCAIVSVLMAVATVVLAFTVGFQASDSQVDAVAEVFQDYESSFALYSYADLTTNQ